MKPHHFLPLLALSLLPISACDTGGADDDEVGQSSSSMEITGSVQGSYTGTASLTIFPDPVSGGGFQIVLSFDDNEGIATLALGGRPETGTFAVGTSDGYALQANLPDIQALPDEAIGLVDFAEGSVTITSASNQRVEGRFTGSGTTLSGQHSVSVSGEFEAVCSISCGSFATQ